MSRADGQSGFTLLEVVVAVMVLGLAVAASFNVFSTGFRQSGAAERHVVAVIHAENKLAALGTLEPIVPGETEGDIDGTYRWRLAVAPVPEDEAEREPDAPRPVRIDVTVLWGGDADPDSVTLTTYRLAPP